MEEYKTMILGSGGVGKSAIVIQFVSHHFVEEYDPTIEDSYRKVITVDGTTCLMEIYDTAGREEYQLMREQFMGLVSGFLLVYSISSHSSFVKIGEFYEHIKRVKEGKPYTIILCGNKSDLELMREIPKKDGEKLASEMNVPFFETSAKTLSNIEELMYTLIRMMKKEQHPQPKKHKVKCILL